jgi:hypothetical protein
MATWNGRPVLARLSASEIPAVADAEALAGLRAGINAAIDYAGSHTAAAEIVFTAAKRMAQQHPAYGYSHQFLAGVELAKPHLLRLAGQDHLSTFRQIAGACITCGEGPLTETSYDGVCGDCHAAAAIAVREADMATARAEEDRIAGELAGVRVELVPAAAPLAAWELELLARPDPRTPEQVAHDELVRRDKLVTRLDEDQPLAACGHGQDGDADDDFEFYPMTAADIPALTATSFARLFDGARTETGQE